MNIGSCLVTVAKFSGLCQGLIMAWNHGVCWLIVKVLAMCNAVGGQLCGVDIWVLPVGFFY